MVSNSRLLMCSNEMHKFMEANELSSIKELFDISIHELVSHPAFPHRLLTEWLLLRDKFNLLCEN